MASTAAARQASACEIPLVRHIGSLEYFSDLGKGQRLTMKAGPLPCQDEIRQLLNITPPPKVIVIHHADRTGHLISKMQDSRRTKRVVSALCTVKSMSACRLHTQKQPSLAEWSWDGVSWSAVLGKSPLPRRGLVRWPSLATLPCLQ